ncbi:ankyrin repeat domain-containing protein [Legionella parisiensis]|uniref:Phosphocholine transferase AnkX n=1 Tax=Legionella parisiensis TaxID=45071 RepID=A0A1E5JME3_9GAMM|nr:ankyrin repeat domain-containing protein [Legionella parisiensis]KTD42562.1 Ankyrin repeat protein [Legionella parisiensis]OEH45715.1 Phosphocholine transferase AnkX [Legionella parisiensis]STX71760.1 Ankyrin repeat protein [Legionella parisiensis]
MNFDLLCLEIGISAAQPLSKKLELLQAWFQKNISTELHPSGGENEQFEQYKQVTEFYLDFVHPESAHDMSKPNQNFNGDNLVSFLSYMGFDRVLYSLQPDKTLLNAKNTNGLTPLHQAALEGNINTVQMLLSLGADPCIINKQKQYPLFSALILPILYEDELRENKIKIFSLLKEKGNQLLNQDKNGDTVLHKMAQHGFDSLIKEILVTHAELAYIPNKHTHYPIHTAILNDQIQCVIPLLHIKDGTILVDSSGWAALHYAARYGSQDILEECCKLTTNKDIPDFTGKTPLMIAAELGRLSTVQILLQHGAQTNITDSSGFSVLHHAVKSGNLKLVRWLIENTDIDINAKDNHNLTPLQLSETSLSETGDMEKITALLLEHGASATPPVPY